MQITDRKAWGALPPEDPPTLWNVAALDGICQHWFGSPKAAATHAGCDDLLRSVQRTHQAGEYNDIAYNFGVCPHGTVYELRGWNVRTGANGTTDANSRFLAIVYMAGTGDPLTVKGKAALEDLYAEAFQRGVAVHAITHGSITGSACPGPAVREWLATGDWKPKPPEPNIQWRVVLIEFGADGDVTKREIVHRETHTPGDKPTAYDRTVAWLASAAGEKVVKDAADEDRQTLIVRAKV